MHAVTTPGSRPALLACSPLVFYEPYWEVLRRLATTYRLSVLALGPERVAVPTVYAPTGWIEARSAAHGIDTIALPLRDPSTRWLGFEPRALSQALSRLSPAAIWVQDEPTSGVAQQLLPRFWWRSRRPRIGVAIVENIWRAPRRLAGLRQRLLVRRIDHFFGGSTEAVRSFRAAFKADSASHEVAFLPTCDHRSERSGSGPGFVLGFAGRICAEKGWRVLLEALRGLPPDVTLRMAGTGPEDAELRAVIQSPGLAGRATFLGVVSGRDLATFYRSIDTLVVPSLTTPAWKEQVGAVLPEAMSAEVPVIGSDSGAIPEVIGAAGVVVPEGDPVRLRDAIARLRSDPEERRRLALEGRRRYEREFSIEAFARRVAAFCSPATR
jgi:glycosyltransferase involved in cell wall biosynthesis